MRYPSPSRAAISSELTNRMKESASAVRIPLSSSGIALGTTTSHSMRSQIDPGRRHRAQRRQSERRDEAAARAGFPREREQEQREVSQQRGLNATLLRSAGGRGNGRLDHDARPVCALIASMRTKFQISSTLSVKPLFLKIAGSLLSNLVSTIALMRPGRADITATRSAR